MNHLKSLGPLALASRLKNLSDTLMQGVARIYREMELDFQPRWFPVTHYLFTYGPSPVTTLSSALKQSHPAILQVTHVMKNKGLIVMRKDEIDLRKTIVELTPAGRMMAQGLIEAWNDIAAANARLMKESRAFLLDDIDKLEQALLKEDIYARVKQEEESRMKI